MQLRGAAALLYDGQTIVHGSLPIDRLARVWPRGDGGGLPPRAFGPIQFRGLPHDLSEALVEAGVVAVVPIESPRRRWGDAFVTTDLRGASFSDEDDEAVDVFAAQLALVLDAAELLARAVAVERSLAHTEKLAAIGELAARIAHEIRNPVTAARSLAQQLGREPDSPLNSEHAQIIVTELERVERQVRALLRFARRETIDLAPVDVAGLVRATIADLKDRLHAAGIRVEEDLHTGVIAYVDRERLRQVLLNLLENAVEALADQNTAIKWIRVGVRAIDGNAEISVTDGGPGVPADALPRLFEPFFSLKATGTGLGLAIARRTVEAHGGRIHAERAAAGGLTVRITLPQSVVRAPAANGPARGWGEEREHAGHRNAKIEGRR
jgi:signal transduction histidine kinase